MGSNSKPMTRLSMETVLGHMPIEKIWNLRKRNPTLKMIADGAPVDQMKKWRVDQIHIKEDQIVANQPGSNSTMVKINGKKQTKWAAPTILKLENADLKSLKEAVNPMVDTFCKHITSIEVVENREIQDELLQTILKLLPCCERLAAFSLHARDVSNAQTMEVLKWFQMKNLRREMCFISLNASAEITPQFIRNFFSPATGTYRSGAVMIKGPETGETETNKRAAIHQFFQLTNSPIQNRLMIFECMDRAMTDALFADLEGQYNQGFTFYLNGSRVFYTKGENNEWISQLEIRRMVDQAAM